jgi:ATP-dependent DNA ligase
VKLFKVAEQMDLEGVVSKRKNAPYRSWPRTDWVKVKTKAWREANEDRGERLQKRGKVDV